MSVQIPSYNDYISSIRGNLEAYQKDDRISSSVVQYFRNILNEIAGVAEHYPIEFAEIATPTDASEMAYTEPGDSFEFDVYDSRTRTHDFRLRLKNKNRTTMFAHVNEDGSLDATVWNADVPTKAWSLYFKL